MNISEKDLETLIIDLRMYIMYDAVGDRELLKRVEAALTELGNIKYCNYDWKTQTFNPPCKVSVRT